MGRHGADLSWFTRWRLPIAPTSGSSFRFLKNEFQMTNTEAGAVVSLFFIGYSVMQIPAGFLVKGSAYAACFRSSWR